MSARESQSAPATAPTEGGSTASVEDELIPLTEPPGGVPALTDSPRALTRLIDDLAHADGPFCIDTERASGFRYGQRAYLIQIKRGDSPIGLIDPIAVDTRPLGELINNAEWVVHSASSDLPCLLELDLSPGRLFDTELAARLLGWPAVGLAAVVARVAGYHLAKEHSAADWSTRPLPPDWLRYAALDVALLPAIHDALVNDLAAAGKTEIAAQEFESIRTTPTPPPRPDPWRRTSGIHKVRDSRTLAIVRELWLARDDVARRSDRAPGRVLPDAAIINAALTKPDSVAALRTLPVFSGRGNARRATTWFGAIARAQQLPGTQLPPLKGETTDGPPPPRNWEQRNPAAAARLAAARELMASLSEDQAIPVENLLSPDLLRRVMWTPPPDVRTRLAQGGARPWQIDLLAEPLTRILHAHPDA